MKFVFKIATFLLATYLCAPASGAASEILKLDWLLGEWRFEDEQLNGEYRESGTRNCELALQQQYILCTTIGVSHTGKKREYLWYFNYNQLEKRYEMSALNSGWPRKDLYRLDLSDDGLRMEVQTLTWKEGGLDLMNRASVIYNGSDQYIWEIRAPEPDPQSGEQEVRFRDTVTRVTFPR